jgi:hypothetical protein
MTLHTVGPEDMAEDEKVIGKGYQSAIGFLYGAIPFGVAYFADIKWVIAVAASILISQSHESGGRIHDLCIRLRRTNLLLRQKRSG